MADFFQRLLKTPCIVWGSPVPDGFGNQSFSAPVQKYCRWDDIVEIITDTKGQEFESKAVIYLSENVPAGSFIMQGTLSGATPANPRNAVGAYPVRRLESYKRLGSDGKLYVVRI